MMRGHGSAVTGRVHTNQPDSAFELMLMHTAMQKSYHKVYTRYTYAHCNAGVTSQGVV